MKHLLIQARIKFDLVYPDVKPKKKQKKTPVVFTMGATKKEDREKDSNDNPIFLT